MKKQQEEQFDRLLKQKEVAEWIGMSEAWLEQCRFRKIGIPFIKCDRACRYRTSDVQKWIDTHLVGLTE
jgi:predicted DNA-binding transcriptional regulator AlpA